MIHHVDFKQVAGLDQMLGSLEVTEAGLGVSAGMIVHQENCGRAQHNCSSKHLPGMNQRGILDTD